VAVMLPAAFYTLRQTRLPPVMQLLQACVPVAVASDSNPGTAPMTSLLLAMNMACTLFRMTPEQVLAGTTLHAARALGIAADTGSIEIGKQADLALWDLLLAMNMACTLFRMTPEQVLAGTTLHAARALGIAADTGSIEIGKQADLALWDLDKPAELTYLVGVNRLYRRYYAGQHEAESITPEH